MKEENKYKPSLDLWYNKPEIFVSDLDVGIRLFRIDHLFYRDDFRARIVDKPKPVSFWHNKQKYD